LEPHCIIKTTMQKVLVGVSLIVLVLAGSTSCSRYRKYAETKAVERVLDEKRIITLRFLGVTNPKPTMDDMGAAMRRITINKLRVPDLGAALRVIDARGCPQEFRLAWKHYIEVLSNVTDSTSHRAELSPVGEAENRIVEAAQDAGVPPSPTWLAFHRDRQPLPLAMPPADQPPRKP